MYRDVDSPKKSEILGRFTRAHHQLPGELKKRVEVIVDYAAHMDADTKRLVICKEICHCFYSDDPMTRSVTQDEIDALMEGLASFNVQGQGQRLTAHSQALSAERWAMITAAEVLCPFDIREELLRHYGGDHKHLPFKKFQQDFGLPRFILETLFSSSYHDNARISFGRIRG